MARLVLSLCGALFAAGLFAQPPKTWEATQLSDTPNLDGSLADSCWQNLSPAGDFTTAAPVFGLAPHCSTRVWLFYTETALYVAARCDDPDANGLRHELGMRDDPSLTGDWFGVSLDTWHDGRLAFEFAVTAGGVQLDQRHQNGNWDARWQSAVARDVAGWTLEICIPFSALRYPRNREQRWGLQFSRYDRSSGELSTWNPQNPLTGDLVLQFGTLTGVRDIRQGKRRSLSLSSKANSYNYTNGPDEYPIKIDLGLDAQIGLNESSTLDFSIVPPLSYSTDSYSFQEVIFSGKDPYLPARRLENEEQDLFQKGGGVVFSPEIPAVLLLWRDSLPPPAVYRDFSDGSVVQATKFSARTRGNWRFGVYNAFLGPVRGTSSEPKRITFQPLSSYNYLCAEYLLRNNGYINISNTMLLGGKGYNTLQPALDVQVRDRSNSYEVRGKVHAVRQWYRKEKIGGASYDVSVARINRRWGWSVQHRSQTERYFPDLLWSRYGRNPNGPLLDMQVNFRSFTPRGRFLNFSGGLGELVAWTDPSYKSFRHHLYGFFSALDRKFQRFRFDLRVVPYIQTVNYDGFKQDISPEAGAFFEFSSDQRRRLQCTLGSGGSAGIRGELPEWRNSLALSWVAGQHLRLTLEGNSQAFFRQMSLLNGLSPSGKRLFYRRNSWLVYPSLGLNGHPMANIQFFASATYFNRFFTGEETLELQSDGTLKKTDLTPDMRFALYSEKNLLGTLGCRVVFSGVNQIQFRHSFGATLGSVTPFDRGDVVRSELQVLLVIE